MVRKLNNPLAFRLETDFRPAKNDDDVRSHAFDGRDECGETECRLTDAAAQQGSLAAHVTSLYQAARDSSRSLAEEVERRTEEAEAQRQQEEARQQEKAQAESEG